jgi:REP element-mobilizing transposase RayT
MPSGLHRIFGAHHLHFITYSCYRRLPLLSSAHARDRFLAILEQTRRKYRFVVVGYVVMPEHIHVLLTEPERGTPSTIMQILKQRTAHALLPKRRRKNPRQRELFGESPPRWFWQARFYDFNVWPQEAGGEAALHASQSREARPGRVTRAVALEQLPSLSAGRARASTSERRMGRDFVS